MIKENKTIVYDEELRIEACRFEGTKQPFPSHFHEYYVLGLVEKGKRCLSCKNTEYTIQEGDILLFHPGDSHACVQSEEGVLDYRSFHISQEVMQELAEEITGRRELPGFSENVIQNEEISYCLRSLHEMVMKETESFGREEGLLFLISSLIQYYGQPFSSVVPECRQEIERACEFIKSHYKERIYLNQICRAVGLSKSTLLRAFTRAKGVTPYRYLENIRINEARRLLGQGVSALDAAIQTGFSDQSHFTNYFSRFIGLPPGTYREIFSEKEHSKKEYSKKDCTRTDYTEKGV